MLIRGTLLQIVWRPIPVLQQKPTSLPSCTSPVHSSCASWRAAGGRQAASIEVLPLGKC